MRRALLPLTALLFLLSGCVEPVLKDAADVPEEDARAAAAAASEVLVDEQPQERPAPPDVVHVVAHDADFGPNACVAGACAFGLGSFYEHSGPGTPLRGGLLHIDATPYAPHEVLHVSASVYKGCDDVCEFVEELASNDGVGAFDLEVPAYALAQGQSVGVRFTPVAPLGAAFATSGWAIDLTGTLAFAGE